jgi:hypothetical protein
LVIAKSTSWYERALSDLKSELDYVNKNLEDVTPPSQSVLRKVKEFLATASGLNRDIPFINISYDGDVNLRWGRGYETLLVSFCYDGLDHYCHGHTPIDRDQSLEVLRDGLANVEQGSRAAHDASTQSI